MIDLLAKLQRTELLGYAAIAAGLMAVTLDGEESDLLRAACALAAGIASHGYSRGRGEAKAGLAAALTPDDLREDPDADG